MMFRIHFLLCLGVCFFTGCRPFGKATTGSIIPDLELVSVYPVESPTLLEPSGMTLHDGRLYAVADKVNNQIFRVELEGNVARLVPHIQFSPPDRRTMDWEGITSDPGGSFYLISEERGRLLRVTADGTAVWITPDLRNKGRSLGLFAKSNAGFEGVAWLGPNHWIGAAEREKRGLVEWSGLDSSLEIEAQLHMESPYKGALPLMRLPDFSGLHADNSNLYALFRNAHLVVQLEKRDGVWEETAAWGFENIETDPRWAYRSQTYGQAEGLVVDGSDVFLILDNNRGGKQSDPADRRPLLIHARIPDGH
ncbi:hypothetical protein G0Q06_13365 [Puniceicoccales bacterium CK1056]|uniref:Phytase-like domain-containing protein n=1 Tax=Oceanipulchritudo coccoides TaxID=2706888 RepID=A0A6B2M3A6_9BACT|nr:SdiA-regulated domain-containing protein [Oceanipulchritudo coccoides]NDV63448.1 hypothetical protein [Oceanipulchritudo coccoides]